MIIALLSKISWIGSKLALRLNGGKFAVGLFDAVLAMDFTPAPAADGDGTRRWESGELAISQLRKVFDDTTLVDDHG